VDPLAEDFPGWTPYHYVHNNPVNLIDPTGMSAEPPVKGLEYFRDYTGEYFWNGGKDLYEHYTYNDNGSTSFNGYYDASEFKEPVGDYSIIFNLSGQNNNNEKYDPSKTIWSIASPLVAYLASVEELKDISNNDLYPGVQILSSSKMNGAITLGNLIIVNSVMAKDGETLDHEYGHFLDYKHHFKYNQEAYIRKVGIPSVISAMGNGIHEKSVSEKRANRIGGEYNGNKALKNKYRP